MLAATIIVSVKLGNFSARAVDGPQNCGGLYYFFLVVYLIGGLIIIKVIVDSQVES
jgi:archaellum biogenesis protein FlaJ (TadC family)